MESVKEGVKEEIKNLKLPKIANELLRRRRNGELTHEEFDKEIAYWFIDIGLEKLRYRFYPTAPQEVKDYYVRKKDDPDYKLDNSFWNKSYILAWRMQRSHIFHENWSNRYWLKFLKNTLPQEDTVNHNRVDVMMKTHNLEQIEGQERKRIE